MSNSRRIRISKLNKISDISRPDTSTFILNNIKDEGYSEVVFVANIGSDPDCEVLDGNIYSIDELLELDNPLYRISHPNCVCEFKPYDSSGTIENFEDLNENQFEDEEFPEEEFGYDEPIEGGPGLPL